MNITRPSVSFKEGQAVQPGKLVGGVSGDGILRSCFKEAQAVQPGKSRRSKTTGAVIPCFKEAQAVQPGKFLREPLLNHIHVIASKRPRPFSPGNLYDLGFVPDAKAKLQRGPGRSAREIT